MVTLWFKPGPYKLQIVKAIMNNAHISLREAKDAVDMERVKCEAKYKDAVIKAIEESGGKMV